MSYLCELLDKLDLIKVQLHEKNFIDYLKQYNRLNFQWKLSVIDKVQFTKQTSMIIKHRML